MNTIYVSSSSGSDLNDGSSEKSPVETLRKQAISRRFEGRYYRVVGEKQYGLKSPSMLCRVVDRLQFLRMEMIHCLDP